MIRFLLAILLVSGIMTVLTIVGTFTKNDWGINLDPIRCPRCNANLSKVKKPKSLHQILWGGGTCGVCGTVMDKWGRQIGVPRTTPNS
jgi:hypothetical protein